MDISEIIENTEIKEDLNKMKILIGRDSNLIKSLIKESNESEHTTDLNIKDEDIVNFDFQLLDRINLDLLSRFYGNEEIRDDELIELAQNLDYLDSSKLKEILYSIRNKKLDYSSLNDNLIDIIKNVRFTQIACGGTHTSAIKDNGSVYTWGNSE